MLAPSSRSFAQDSATVASKPAPRHPPVCADGVRRYPSLADVPVPFDSLAMPRGEPVRIHGPADVSAAERLMAERAGGVGATGIVVADQSEADDGGIRRVTRRVIPVFVPADSARAHAACSAGRAGTSQPDPATPDRPDSAGGAP
jgi:hypothetical protein